MSKIAYHKYCRNHTGVKKVKREFIKLLNQCNSINPHCCIEFTGVVEQEVFNLNYYIKSYYEKLKNKLIEEFKSDPLFPEFSTDYYIGIMKFISGIEKIKEIVHNDYTNEVFEYIFTFSNPEASFEEKKREYQRHFEANPLIGFHKAFIAYRGENKRQIWPLTLSPDDLSGVDKIVIQYQ